jgi:hypothetical protein
MKSKIIIASIILISGLLVLGYFKATPGAENGSGNGPEIEILPKIFEFGDIQYGQIVEYDFSVKNSGNDALEIKKVATSCSCTTAKVDRETIPPGETADLHVRYDSGAMGSLHGKGRQERIIYIRSNDPINPQAEVMIYANVK